MDCQVSFPLEVHCGIVLTLGSVVAVCWALIGLMKICWAFETLRLVKGGFGVQHHVLKAFVFFL